jgi:hypothetical protein
MAKKVNLMKLTLETQAQAEVTNRRHAPFSPALYLMQLRLPRLRISPSKRKLPVIMDSESCDDMPQQVKIRHVA